MHGKLSKVIHRNEGVFKGIKNEFNVTRYHSLVVSYDGFPSCLRITAKAEDGTIMGIKHRRYCIEGVQFHPEAELTEYGHELLQGFIVQAR
jgi:para-aminobenzoate synthetase component 2